MEDESSKLLSALLSIASMDVLAELVSPDELAELVFVVEPVLLFWAAKYALNKSLVNEGLIVVMVSLPPFSL